VDLALALVPRSILRERDDLHLPIADEPCIERELVGSLRVGAFRVEEPAKG
jgi:hypothetical protein